MKKNLTQADMDLRAAIINGSIRSLYDALRRGADVNAAGEMPHDRLPIFMCIEERKADYFILRTLINYGADVTACDDHQGGVLLMACAHERDEFIDVLIESGAPVNGDPGAQPLFLAVRNENASTIRKLVEAGADIHARSVDGSTALESAAWAGWEQNVSYLISAGADPCAKNQQGQTPLDIAQERVQYLKDAINRNAFWDIETLRAYERIEDMIRSAQERRSLKTRFARHDRQLLPDHEGDLGI